MPLNNPAIFEGYDAVDTFADLPSAEKYVGEVWLVQFATGVIFINRKRAGLYLSNGTSWDRLGVIQKAGTAVGYLPSNPPSGKCVVTNLFVDPQTGKLAVEYENMPLE